MVCPYCNKEETNVIDSRKNNDGKSIRRRRECPTCKIRFTTYEKAEIELVVLKRNGNIQSFDYEKLYMNTVMRNSRKFSIFLARFEVTKETF